MVAARPAISGGVLLEPGPVLDHDLPDPLAQSLKITNLTDRKTRINSLQEEDLGSIEGSDAGQVALIK